MFCSSQLHKATGAVATSRHPLLRAIRLATYLNAVDAAGTAAASTCIQSALSAYRQYRSAWNSANRSRAARTVVQDWNLDLLVYLNESIAAVHNDARRFWGRTIVETTAAGFNALLRMCNGCSDIKEKAKLRRQIVGIRSYRRFQLELVFTSQFAAVTGMRPLGFISIDLLSKAEWDARVRNGRRPEVETALVRYDRNTWLFSRCDGKGARGAAPKERSGLWTRDPVTHAPDQLAALLPLLEQVWEGYEILTTDDHGNRQRHYVDDSGGIRKSEALFTKRRRSKFFKDKSGHKLFAPPYCLPQSGRGVAGPQPSGEGGTMSGLFTTDVTAVFAGMQTGLPRLYRYKLDVPIVLADLEVEPNARAVASRWRLRPKLKVSLYDYRRAKSTSVLAALDCARAWRAAGGGETIVHAMKEVVENSLKLSDHGEQVARQFYMQTSPIESARLLKDAQRIKTEGPAHFIDLDLNDSSEGVEAQIQLSHRHIGWSTLAKFARKGTIHWDPVVAPENRPVWVLAAAAAGVVAMLVAMAMAAQP